MPERPLRILHVYKVYYPESHGGIEQVICQLATASLPLGVESSVLCLAHSPRPAPIRRPEATVHQTKIILDKASTPLGLEIFRRFPQLLRKSDLVHYHFPYPLQDLLHLWHRVRRPSVVTYHSDIIRQRCIKRIYEPLLMHRFLRQVSAIVATSPQYARSSEVLQRHRDKVTVIPIGLDPTAYPVPSVERLASWQARMPEPFFLFVGVLRYYKGLHILLEALAGTGHRVVIAGTGPEEGRLREQAARLQLSGVTFLGWIDDADKMALLQQCRAVVFPSHQRSEAFGVTLLEGAMSGKPLICAELGTGTTHVNVSGTTGIAVPPADPAALRAAMDVLAGNPGLAAQYGGAARERFDHCFTAEAMARQYKALYHQLLCRATV